MLLGSESHQERCKQKTADLTSGGRLVLPTGELLLPALASHIRGLSLTSMAPWRLHRQVAVSDLI